MSDEPRYLYHGTLEELLPSIAADGLDPRHGGLNWAHSDPVVYLTKNMDSARTFAKGDNEFADGTPVVLRIDLTALEAEKLGVDRFMRDNFPDNRDHFQYEGVIPPEAIEIMDPSGDLRPVAECRPAPGLR